MGGDLGVLLGSSGIRAGMRVPRGVLTRTRRAVTQGREPGGPRWPPGRVWSDPVSGLEW